MRHLIKQRYQNWIKKMISVSNKSNILVVTVFLEMLLSGCTTCANAVPDHEPTMAEIYEQAMQDTHSESIEKARLHIQKIQQASSRQSNPKVDTAEYETNALFPMLPNPQLVMYVYPHLSGENEAPVPGYKTAFNLYERNYYTLEGES
jgi:conjugative transfer region lipoprotein (TIGR03751 family)